MTFWCRTESIFDLSYAQVMLLQLRSSRLTFYFPSVVEDLNKFGYQGP
jgi:hypothetical protein